MNDRIITQEMVETFRAGFERLSHQRTKLEKIQRMRQTIEELGLAGRCRQAEACNADA